MNLAEYATLDMRWYWELRAALAAFRDGQEQSGSVRKKIAEEIEARKEIGLVG